MKRMSLLAAALAVAAVTSTASATLILEDGINATITETPLGMASDGLRDVGIVYDSVVFEGNVSSTLTGEGGSVVEDYVSTITTPSTLEIFQFAGGVDTANHVLFFGFYDTAQNLVDSFGIRLSSASLTSLWTITLNDPTSVTVPAAGFCVMIADDGTNNPDLQPTEAAWRYKDVAPAIGTTSDEVYRMSMQVIPEPASLSMLAIGGLALLRRRTR